MRQHSRHDTSPSRQYHVQQAKQGPAAEQSREILFISDRKGDLANVQYGSLDQYKVSRYRNAGFGRLIGLDRRFRSSTSSTSLGRQIEDESLDSSRIHQRQSLLESVTTESESGTFQVRISDADNSFASQVDYINIAEVQQNDDSIVVHEDPVNGHSEELQGAMSIRIHPVSSNAQDATNKHHHQREAAESDPFEQYRNDPITKRNNELLRAVEDNPQDVHSWVALIDHQENNLSLSSQQDPRITSTANKQVVADMRISLYHKALSKTKSTHDQIILIRGMMREGSRVWDTDQQIKEWQGALHRTTSLSLWLDFLSFQQRNAVGFSYENCVELHLQVFNRARQSKESDQYLVNLLLRLTTFLRHAGYVERAIAIWQANIETTFFRPAAVDPVMLMPALGQFWESEAPRIGEKIGKGWNHSDSVPATTQTDAAPLDIGTKEIWKDWVAVEGRLSNAQIMPARSLDDALETDPYRVILFSDVQDFIIQGSEATFKALMIQALLRFCGLPPMQMKPTKVDLWQDDTVHLSWLDTDEPSIPRFVLTEPYSLAAPTDSHFSCFPLSAVRLSPLLDFATRVLSELVGTDNEPDHLIEYLIALKSVAEPEVARKFTKSLLRKRSDHPRVYNVYGLVQARAGKLDEAEKIWSTAISLTTSFDTSMRAQVVLLWDSWIWELLTQKHFDRALKLLVTVLPGDTQDLNELSCAATRNRAFAEADVLQSRHYLSGHITSSIPLDDTDNVVAYTNLLAILNYLLSSNNLDEALRTYQSTLTSIENRSNDYTSERIHQSRARLIDLHARCSPTGYRPIQVTIALQQSVQRFPSNSLFHSLHEKYSRQAGLIDRLRTNITIKNPDLQSNHLNNDTSQASIRRDILALSTELSRPLYAGSTPHTIRAAFKTATAADSPARYIPQIWLTWLRWELSLLPAQYVSTTNSAPFISGEVSKRLKEIYLSALRACPGVKEVYMLGFAVPVMRHVMGFDGLEDVYRSMLDRGLRLRVDIEDLLDERRQAL